MDTATLITVAGLLVSGAAIIPFWMRLSDRITKADAKAEAAAVAAKSATEMAQESKKDAHEAAEKIAIQTAAFGLYREQIAREYIHREVMREVEERLTAAIDRLGDRLDRVLEKSGVH